MINSRNASGQHWARLRSLPNASNLWNSYPDVVSVMIGPISPLMVPVAIVMMMPIRAVQLLSSITTVAAFEFSEAASTIANSAAVPSIIFIALRIDRSYPKLPSERFFETNRLSVANCNFAIASFGPRLSWRRGIHADSGPQSVPDRLRPDWSCHRSRGLSISSSPRDLRLCTISHAQTPALRSLQ